ncbi:MAG TPA: transposase [Candidatus Binatia bacterium]|jgi:REP element-mobilizing transposase RayT|nr:transposase [Candidatus Binatia bacterium]
MSLFRQKYRVESTRLQTWDYRAAGWYFVTICTYGGICFFGDVVDGEVRLSEIGKIVAEEWQRAEQVRSYVVLDQWVIMPNHMHGIVVIGNGAVPSVVETPRRGVSTALSRWKPNSLGSIIGQFKSVCTKRIWATGFRDFAWQSRFHDHVIRNEKSLNDIREYIINNPMKWELDKDNPANLYM